MLKTAFCCLQGGSPLSATCTHLQEKSLLWITNLKANSFSFSFLPGKILHRSPFSAGALRHTARLLWTARNSSKRLRCEGDLQSLAAGDDVAEQRCPCLHSFKWVPEVLPSPCAAHPPHRLTKGHIHQWAAMSYNPSERHQVMPALPGLVVRSSSCSARTRPEQSLLASIHVGLGF